MNILGISAFYHDSAACLIQDGKLVAAASEERFTRKKHDHNFPKNAIEYCLKAGNITKKDLDYVGFYEKPFVKFERILCSYLATFPRSFPSFIKAIPLWLHEKLWIPQTIRKELDFAGKIIFIDHHLSHAASSFLMSPYDEAAILTTDGVGEWSTTTMGVGNGTDIKITKELRFPHSLGLLYTAFTSYLGFKVNSAEYKVMGLAPYGEPRYEKLIFDRLVQLKEDGSFQINTKYFPYVYGLRMINRHFEDLFGQPEREPETKLEAFHKDIAASIQSATEQIVLHMCRALYNETKLTKLCMAGGVALNCVANGRIVKETPFRELFVQPAAGDAGGAVGVAAYIHFKVLGNKRHPIWPGPFLGPEYSENEIRQLLNSESVPYRELDEESLAHEVAKLIDEQNVIGWFQGRMEFGPRALGNRSILADARHPENRDRVNLKIKFRESFRPFAPSVLAEQATEYFDLNQPSPYMLLVAQVHSDKQTIPAVTHVDGSARVQTVAENENPKFYRLIKAFYKLTGCPVIINTSFNVRGEPIVCTPQDAFRCFLHTNMDYLVLGNFLLDKKAMPESLRKVLTQSAFAPD